MVWLAIVSSLPLVLPASCWATACGCDLVCPTTGPAGCIALAGLASAALFAVLALTREFSSLSSIRE